MTSQVAMSHNYSYFMSNAHDVDTTEKYHVPIAIYGPALQYLKLT